MLRGSLLLLLLFLPLHAAGEIERGDGLLPAIEATQDSYVAHGTAELATALRVAVAGIRSEGVSAFRYMPFRSSATRPALVTLVDAETRATSAGSPLSQARQRGLLPWSTAPPALA